MRAGEKAHSWASGVFEAPKVSRQLRKFEVLIYRWEAYVPKVYKRKAILFKMPVTYFAENKTKQAGPRIDVEYKRTGIVKTILKKKVGESPTLYPELTMGTVMKTVWY